MAKEESYVCVSNLVSVIVSDTGFGLPQFKLLEEILEHNFMLKPSIFVHSA